jgi:hypothetical protein
MVRRLAEAWVNFSIGALVDAVAGLRPNVLSHV